MWKNIFVPLACLLTFLSAVALSRESRPWNDAIFVRRTLQAEIAEDERAKSALKQEAAPPVRAVAAMVLRQNSTSEAALRAATHASGLTPPAQALPPRQPSPSALAYLRQTAAQQRDALHLFQKEADEGQKPALRAYARRHLPVIREELIAAEQNAQRMYSRNSAAHPAAPEAWPTVTPAGLRPPTIAPEPEG